MPPFAAIGLYVADSPLNSRIPADARIDPDSSAMVKGLFAAGDTSFVVNLRKFSSTVYFADSQTPRYDVAVPCGDDWGVGVSQLAGVPIPAWAEASNDSSGEEAPPEGCGEASSLDNHMVVLDLSGRCEYDMWQARRTGDTWVASWANAISLDSTGIYPNGMSSRGSGFAFLGGVIWPDELRQGRIEHALTFAYPFTKAGGPVPPATDSDGESSEAFAIPEGARLRLDPTLDLTRLGLSTAEYAIARALQEYGMYLVDNAGDAGVALYAVDPRSFGSDPYGDILPQGDYPALAGIPLDRLQVLELPRQIADWRANLKPQASSCANFK
jgi:hypothetical protein